MESASEKEKGSKKKVEKKTFQKFLDPGKKLWSQLRQTDFKELIQMRCLRGQSPTRMLVSVRRSKPSEDTNLIKAMNCHLSD